MRKFAKAAEPWKAGLSASLRDFLDHLAVGSALRDFLDRLAVGLRWPYPGAFRLGRRRPDANDSCAVRSAPANNGPGVHRWVRATGMCRELSLLEIETCLEEVLRLATKTGLGFIRWRNGHVVELLRKLMP